MVVYIINFNLGAGMHSIYRITNTSAIDRSPHEVIPFGLAGVSGFICRGLSGSDKKNIENRADPESKAVL